MIITHKVVKLKTLTDKTAGNMPNAKDDVVIESCISGNLLKQLLIIGKKRKIITPQ